MTQLESLHKARPFGDFHAEVCRDADGRVSMVVYKQVINGSVATRGLTRDEMHYRRVYSLWAELSEWTREHLTMDLPRPECALQNLKLLKRLPQ